MTKPMRNTGKANLRQKAKELLAERISKIQTPNSEFEVLKLIHELEVHQIELELQNEELILAKAAEKKVYDEYIDLYDFSPSAYFTLSIAGKIIGLNLTGAKMLGMERSYLKNSNFSNYLAIDNQVAFKSFIDTVVLKKKSETFELKLLARDKKTRHVHMSGALREGMDQVFLTVTDISDLIQAKERQMESEERYLTMFADSPDAYLIIVDGLISDCNRAAERLVLRSRESIIGLTPEAFSPEFQPDGRRSSVAVLEEISECLRTGKTNFEWTMRTSAGTDLVVDVTISMIEIEGRMAIFSSCRDISARKMAEQSLEDNEQKFRSLFETMALGIVYQDSKGYIFSANPAAHRILGLTLDQMQGRTSMDPNWRAIREDGTDFPGHLHPAMIALETGKEVNDVVMGVFHPEKGEYSWINVHATPQFLHDHAKPSFVFAVFEDITGRIKAEDAIRENELRYRTLANSGQALIWTATTDKKCDYFNQVWLDFTGKTLEEEIGDGWVAGVHPEDRERCFNIFSGSFDKREPFSMVYRLRRNDGVYRWLQDSGTPRFDLHANFTGYIGHCLDITDLIQAKNELDKREEQYRFITERSNDLIFVFRLKPEPGFEYVSPSAETITGYTPEDHYNDPGLGMKLIHPDDRHLLKDLQRGKIDTGISRLRWIKKDGSIIWTESQNIPIYDKNGELSGIQGKATDITERVKNEQIMDARLRLNEFAYTHSKQEIQLFLVEELEKLTGSRIGFFHSVNPDQETMELQCWSTNMKSLVGGPVPSGTHFEITKAGIWHDCMEERKAVIHNDYIKQPHLKRMPKGHDIITRQLAVPVIRNEKIVAIVGIGNKPTQYDNWDVEIITKLSDLAWDIYEVKRIQEDLLKLSQAIIQSPAMTIITDLHGDIEYVNPAVEKMSGYSQEELKGKNPRILRAKEAGDDSESKMYETLNKGEEWNGEFLNSNKDGKLYWVSASISPVLNSEGKATHFIAVQEDITGRKQSEKTILELNAGLEQKIEQRTAQLKQVNTSLESEIKQHRLTESALLESREQLDLAIKGSNDAPWDWNLVTDYLYYSDKWWQQLGYEHNEIPADSNLWRNLTHPDDIGFTHDILVNALQNNQDSYEAEFRLQHKLGHYVPVLSRGYISRDVNGKAIRVTGTNQDLTERKKAEEALKWNKTLLELMANSSPFGFLVVDNRTDDIMYINHRFCEIWEIEQIEDRIHRGEMKNNDIIPYCIPVLADIPAFAESCKPLQDEANRIELLDVIAFTGNRSIQRFSTQIRGKDDEYYGRFYIFEDITARTIVENELKEAKTEAEKANQAKSEFLSRISHELRTPLNSILGFAQLLDMDDLKKSQKRGVGHILKGGRHLLEMINEVLDISKIEAGQLSMSIRSVNVRQLIHSMMDVVSPIAADFKVSMMYNNDHKEDIYVRADEQRLNQVMLNLLNNAIKYNVPGGSVVIRCCQSNPEEITQAESVRISITDTGKGISEEDISKLYVPFERIGAENSNIEGTGLGLAVVKKLLDAMNGRIGIDSTPGEGSTFWIELPLSGKITQVAAGEKEEPGSGIRVSHNQGTILYIEDNVPNAELVRMVVETSFRGVRLITSETGSRTVELAREYSPDLILLDLNLPDTNGKDVLRNLKSNEDTKAIPVVIISADAMPHQLHDLMDEGAAVYLTKPLDIEKFNRLLNEYIPGEKEGGCR